MFWHTTIKAILNIIKADEGTGLIAALSVTNDDESRVLQFFTVGAAVFIAAAACIAEQVVCQRRGKSALQ
ncbi:MAG: hypothetical protein K2H90_04200 [Oscillospiraceae bacterium]|nr:hypothetical protein [Oscillospiraceae bacterium]